MRLSRLLLLIAGGLFSWLSPTKCEARPLTFRSAVRYIFRVPRTVKPPQPARGEPTQVQPPKINCPGGK